VKISDWKELIHFTKIYDVPWTSQLQINLSVFQHYPVDYIIIQYPSKVIYYLSFCVSQTRFLSHLAQWDCRLARPSEGHILQYPGKYKQLGCYPVRAFGFSGMCYKPLQQNQLKLTRQDKILVSRESGNLLMSGTVLIYIHVFWGWPGEDRHIERTWVCLSQLEVVQNVVLVPQCNTVRLRVSSWKNRTGDDMLF